MSVNQREVARDWSQALLSMASGSDLGEAALCAGYFTARGISAPATVATRWCQEGVTWTGLGGDELHGFIGPVRPAITSVCLRRVGASWRFAGWAPGK